MGELILSRDNLGHITEIDPVTLTAKAAVVRDKLDSPSTGLYLPDGTQVSVRNKVGLDVPKEVFSSYFIRVGNGFGDPRIHTQAASNPESLYISNAWMQRDKDFWRQGNPMPDWGEEALGRFIVFSESISELSAIDRRLGETAII
jgi:hypothetical protein